jgi:hypothetical protein
MLVTYVSSTGDLILYEPLMHEHEMLPRHDVLVNIAQDPLNFFSGSTFFVLESLTSTRIQTIFQVIGDTRTAQNSSKPLIQWYENWIFRCRRIALDWRWTDSYMKVRFRACVYYDDSMTSSNTAETNPIPWLLRWGIILIFVIGRYKWDISVSLVFVIVWYSLFICSAASLLSMIFRYIPIKFSLIHFCTPG